MIGQHLLISWSCYHWSDNICFWRRASVTSCYVFQSHMYLIIKFWYMQGQTIRVPTPCNRLPIKYKSTNRAWLFLTRSDNHDYSCQGTFWFPPNQRTNVENFPNNGKTIKNHGLSLYRTASQNQESIETDCLHFVQRRPDTWLECHGTPLPAVTRPPPSSWPEALTSGRERQKYLIEKYLYSPPTNKQPTKKMLSLCQSTLVM